MRCLHDAAKQRRNMNVSNNAIDSTKHEYACYRPDRRVTDKVQVFAGLAHQDKRSLE
jgi:hypothetical protein